MSCVTLVAPCNRPPPLRPSGRDCAGSGLGRSIPGDRDGALEDGVEHRAGEAAREGVLLAHVIAAEERPVGDECLRAVAEPGSRARHRRPEGRERPERGRPGERAEGDDDADAAERGQLPGEVRRAVVAFRGERLVVRRRAFDRRRDPEVMCFQVVAAPDADRAIGETGGVQRRPQEVSARVAGEDAARPLAAVGGWSEPEEQDPRGGIPEAGHGPAPVRLVAEPRDLLARDLLPPLDEPWTATAVDDLRLDGSQSGPRVAALRRHPGNALRGPRRSSATPSPEDYFSRSLSSRRETTASPTRPITSRYTTWTSVSGPTWPTDSPRSRSTPW